MCGIFGVITEKNDRTTVKLIRDKLLLIGAENQDRGEDSFGVAKINARRSTHRILKDVGKPEEHLKRGDFKVMLTPHVTPSVIMGHTRRATPAFDITKENAHPFWMGKVVGVHNGWISNWKEFLPKATVDSQVIFHMINKSDIKTMSKFYGLAAIAYVNTDDYHTLNFYRDGRPLFLGIPKDENIKAIFFSSMPGELRKPPLQCDVEQVTEFVHISLNTSLMIVESDNKIRMKFPTITRTTHNSHKLRNWLGNDSTGYWDWDDDRTGDQLKRKRTGQAMSIKPEISQKKMRSILKKWITHSQRAITKNVAKTIYRILHNREDCRKGFSLVSMLSFSTDEKCYLCDRSLLIHADVITFYEVPSEPMLFLCDECEGNLDSIGSMYLP